MPVSFIYLWHYLHSINSNLTWNTIPSHSISLHLFLSRVCCTAQDHHPPGGDQRGAAEAVGGTEGSSGPTAGSDLVPWGGCGGSGRGSPSEYPRTAGWDGETAGGARNTKENGRVNVAVYICGGCDNLSRGLNGLSVTWLWHIKYPHDMHDILMN